MSQRLSLLIAALALLPAASARPEEPAADKQFADMLTAAKANPEKTDWKALRRAYSRTSGYNPYNVDYRDALAEVSKTFASGDTKKAEALLTTLHDREGQMRLDAHGLAAVIYEKTGDKEKQEYHRRFVKGIAGTLFKPGAGGSFDNPIHVLFIEEEYLYLQTLGVRPKRQGLQVHEGHRFDVYKLEPRDGEEAREFYFNVDMPQSALSRKLRGGNKPDNKA